MNRQLGRIAILTSLLLVLPLWLMRAQPGYRVELASLLASAEDCSAPCFMGIRPGETTIDEARARLEAHPWVDSLTTEYWRLEEDYGRGILRWTWSETYPAAIDPRIPGRINFHFAFGMAVDAITVHTRLPAEAIIDWYGNPVGGIFSNQDSVLTYGALYRPVADAPFVGVATTLACPVNHLDYWHSRGEIFFIASEGIAVPYVSVADALQAC